MGQSGWRGRMIPFRLKDESGSVLIEPQGAKIEPVVILDKVCRKNDPMYYGKGPAKRFRNPNTNADFTRSESLCVSSFMSWARREPGGTRRKSPRIHKLQCS